MERIRVVVLKGGEVTLAGGRVCFWQRAGRFITGKRGEKAGRRW